MSKGGAQAPNPVDPNVAADAQTRSNLATADANRTNAYGPGGSSVWSRGDDGRWGMTQSLNPTAQKIFESMQNTGLQLSPLGGILASQAMGGGNAGGGAPRDPGADFGSLFAALKSRGVIPNPGA